MQGIIVKPYMSRIDLIKYANKYLDIGFLSIVNKPVFNSAMPTKFFEYINLGMPILATMPINSEAAVVIKNNKIGWVINHGDIDALVNILNFLKSNKNEILVAKKNIEKIRYQFSQDFTQKRMIKSINKLMHDFL
jgi:glycosyltransferase involved in cell wall biosynthesis